MLLGLVMAGSLAGSAGYALYLRSDAYRERAAAALSESLGLPADIERVRPLSLRARQFDGILVWLPDRRGQALRCDVAQVISTPTPSNPDAYELRLSGGSCEISPRTWLGEDYRSVLASGLRPGFAPGGPSRVHFSGMDVQVARDRFTLTLDDASGLVSFENSQSGSAAITCYRLNGYRSNEPIFLDAAFSPLLSGVQADSIELTIPSMSLEVLRLEQLTGTTIRSGTFDGRVTYSETASRRTLAISGHCAGVDLAEVTAMLPRPWRGRCEHAVLQELLIENRVPVAVRLLGDVTDLYLGDVLAPWGLAHVGGKLTLNLKSAVITTAGVERLVAVGRCDGVALESLSAALGHGRMSGTLRLEIHDLTVIDNRLHSLDAEMTVDPAADGSRWIEGLLLRSAVKGALRIDLPPILPERVEYTRLGVRLEVRDEVLRLYGSHGRQARTILSVRLLGTELELVTEPEGPIDLSPHLDGIRSKVAELMRERWDALQARRRAQPRAAGE